MTTAVTPAVTTTVTTATSYQLHPLHQQHQVHAKSCAVNFAFVVFLPLFQNAKPQTKREIETAG